jgi:hypothetical protein
VYAARLLVASKEAFTCRSLTSGYKCACYAGNALAWLSTSATNNCLYLGKDWIPEKACRYAEPGPPGVPPKVSSEAAATDPSTSANHASRWWPLEALAGKPWYWRAWKISDGKVLGGLGLVERERMACLPICSTGLHYEAFTASLLCLHACSLVCLAYLA